VAATSAYPSVRALDIALGQTEQHPYEKLDPRVAQSVKGAEVIKAGDRLTPEEAMGLSSYYKDCGLLKTVDRYDALSKAVGDEDYHYPISGFWTYNPDREKEVEKITRQAYDFRRRGKLNPGVLKAYVKKGGQVPLEDPTDYEATMERLALGGGTARGFWKACTRMSHF
jgi:Mitochondrial ribosomal death-associated protein 3